MESLRIPSLLVKLKYQTINMRSNISSGGGVTVCYRHSSPFFFFGLPLCALARRLFEISRPINRQQHRIVLYIYKVLREAPSAERQRSRARGYLLSSLERTAYETPLFLFVENLRRRGCYPAAAAAAAVVTSFSAAVHEVTVFL